MQLFQKLFIFTLLFFVVVFSSTNAYGAELPPIFERKIVVFQHNVSPSVQVRIITGAGAMYVRILRYGNASVALLDKSAHDELSQNFRVKNIEDDVIVETLTHRNVFNISKERISAKDTQLLPWGVDRVDAEWVWQSPGSMGAGIRVGVIDTGISISHPDLTANMKGGVSEVDYTESWDDDNGHGSHVAGIIAAQNNSFGVVGISHKASLYAIKILDKNGVGYLSNLINGIDWARTHNMNIINMSFGCDCNSMLLHDALLRAYNSGIVIVAAAGNNGDGVVYPAAYPEVIAVSASDSTNTMPYWASRGPEIDFIAPGVGIYSTYKNNTYKSLSGTSIASSHVTGSVALILTKSLDTIYNVEGYCVSVYDVNCNGKWDPVEIRHRLSVTAIDFKKEHNDVYGAGLINAFLAFFL